VIGRGRLGSTSGRGGVGGALSAEQEELQEPTDRYFQEGEGECGAGLSLPHFYQPTAHVKGPDPDSVRHA